MITKRPFISFNTYFLTLCLVFSSCAYAQNSKTDKKPEVKKTNETAPVNDISNLLKRQILLTNAAEFTKNRTMEGASGFLIKYNGANFAVTAKHLLGDAGGVEPEISTNELGNSLSKWEMKPRIVTKPDKETIKLSVKGLDYSQSLTDILLLKVVSESFNIEILTPNFQLPIISETLFLIGCPYSETQCKQNSYEVKFAEFDETEGLLVCEIKSKVVLAGFSGAPLVNGKGEVLGVLVSSAELNGKNYVLATHIKEIQKIKF